ncbi:hypothetical protein GCM10010443_34020 [Actinoplanes cyaneus]|uniref:hypothetical protein n=1 Tax=Actinoplanes cyaneus TaxID=52696 RepID=UPI0031D9EE3E
MYTATPPTPAAPGTAAPPVVLPLARIEPAIFGPGGPFGGDDRIYFTDLLTSYGLPAPAPEQFDRPRNSFTEMVEALVARLGPAARSLELAVFCGVTPDVQPGFPGGRLADLVPGLSLAFALFDQGLAGPYTALDVLARTVPADTTRHAALFVLDQSTLLHSEPVPGRLRVDRDGAVAVVLGGDGELGTIRPLGTVAVPAGEQAARLAAIERELAVDVVVAGRGLAAHRVEGSPAAVPGLPATGTWLTLAAHATAWRGRRVLLADYDADQQRLGACTVELAP